MLPSKAFAAALEIVKADIITRKMEELQPKPRTQIIEKDHERITGSLDVVRAQGPGQLNKFSVVAPANTFSIEIIRDGGLYVKGSYTDLVNKVAAYEEDGTYYLHVTDVKFRESLIIVLSVDSPITFDMIYADLELT